MMGKDSGSEIRNWKLAWKQLFRLRWWLFLNQQFLKIQFCPYVTIRNSRLKCKRWDWWRFCIFFMKWLMAFSRLEATRAFEVHGISSLERFTASSWVAVSWNASLSTTCRVRTWISTEYENSIRQQHWSRVLLFPRWRKNSRQSREK